MGTIETNPIAPVPRMLPAPLQSLAPCSDHFSEAAPAVSSFRSD